MSDIEFEPPVGAKRRFRKKYTSVACLECQRRKQKCSGHKTCLLCRDRDVSCVYPDNPRRKTQRRDARPSPALVADPEPQEIASQSLIDRVRELEATLKLIGELSDKTSLSKKPTKRRSSGAVEFTSYVDGVPDTVSDSQPEELEQNWHSLDETPTPALALSEEWRWRPNPLGDKPLHLHDADERMSVALPESSQVQRLLGIGANTMAIYVPVLDPVQIGNEGLRFIAGRGGPRRASAVLFNRRDSVLVSQLLTRLAVGCGLEHLEGPEEKRCQSWSYYNQGCRLISDTSPKVQRLLELAKHHLLRAQYLMQAEHPISAMDAIWTSTRIALRANLNDQSSWGYCAPHERLYRKRLWWCIYYLERRVAEKCSKPYIIRDEEVNVDEFHHTEVIEDDHTTTEAKATMRTNEFLQALINLAKLWSKIWDKFLGLSTPTNINPEEVELMDTRIVHAQRRLSAWLRCDDSNSWRFEPDPFSELEISRRLVINTVCSTPVQ
ncbi:hypothetical protein NA57DRAFT_80056 [Rhizodiscina lignyota]|uniref:Zn(2)-C6 fungal-type domain-containing protein n=1 Tax=Rhizodiscina lignyota TaxID=1504668 RepID=A0A9P4M529_9PEZI|nr:hypothetical protein NA57DRAFT_80056 [Rhizodiscina lignyota]